MYGISVTASSAASGTTTPHRNGLPSLSSSCTHRKNQGARAVAAMLASAVMGAASGAGK